jgi:pimeloyl-ACP methyl ester carboxylesterase
MATPSLAVSAAPALRRAALACLGLGLLAYLIACLGVYASQDGLIYHPMRATPANTAGTIVLPGADVRVLVSVRERPGARAVLYFGGNAEDVAGGLPDLADAFPAQALYLLHYRGYAGSAGKPSERTLRRDALALFDLVHARHPDIVVVGRSLGSGLAMQVAASRPARRVVLVTPYDSLANVAAGYYPWLPVHWLMRDQFDSASLAPRIRVPTLLLVAGRDQVIPAASTARLLARFRAGVATCQVIEGAGHNDISSDPRYAALLAGRP